MYNFTSETKWVVFGGSYPGQLAAWARWKYPNQIHAAVSSSAPVEAVVENEGKKGKRMGDFEILLFLLSFSYFFLSFLFLRISLLYSSSTSLYPSFFSFTLFLHSSFFLLFDLSSPFFYFFNLCRFSPAFYPPCSFKLFLLLWKSNLPHLAPRCLILPDWARSGFSYHTILSLSHTPLTLFRYSNLLLAGPTLLNLSFERSLIFTLTSLYLH